jgi:rfaE bifunctional protein kinase chain/domain
MSQKTCKEIVQGFPECTVGILGDMMLDIYVLGKPARLSREAPVIVVDFEEEYYRSGGAANAVKNVCSLGARALAVGVVGRDAYGSKLRQILEEGGAGTEGLFEADGFSTITKTRVLAGDLHTVKQQVLRIDRGRPSSPDTHLTQQVLDFISLKGPRVNCWLVSDYGYGFVSDRIEGILADLAVGAPVIADSRYNVKEFSRITAVTPNESEALTFGRYYLKDETDLLVIGQQMLEILHLQCALITRGNEGMILLERGKEPLTIPVVGSREIVDVSGAGDTVAAAFGLSLASGATAEQAARIANCAASIVVMKSGTATCSAQELLTVVERYL